MRNQLVLKREAHDRLLHAIPAVEDPHSAWLLLRYCAAPRANYLLRVLSPAATADYAAEHDAALAACIAGLVGHAGHPLPEGALQTAQLAARVGGLGLRSALSDRHAAH